MSDCKIIGVSLTKEQHQNAKDLSKKVFGKSNVSGYYGYLINIEKEKLNEKN